MIKLYYAIFTDGTTDGLLYESVKELKQSYADSAVYKYDAENNIYKDRLGNEDWAGDYDFFEVVDGFNVRDWNWSCRRSNYKTTQELFEDVEKACKDAGLETTTDEMFTEALNGVDNLKAFATFAGVPYRTLQDWKAKKRNPPDYVKLGVIAMYNKYLEE